MRLRALATDPRAFGSTLAREEAFADAVWRERTAAAASGPERILLLALDRGRAVGIAGGLPGDDPGTRELVSVWVAPGHRRRGIARALVAGVVAWAAEAGAGSVRLHVTEPAAEALYASLGFVDDGRRQPLPHDARVEERGMTLVLGRSPGSRVG